MGSTQKTLGADNWDGTEPYTLEFTFYKEQQYPVPFMRFVNDLDVEATVNVELTDQFDTSRERTADVSFFTDTKTIGWPPIGGFPGGQTEEDTLAIASGANDTYGLPAQWDVSIYTITPTTEPTSGEFRVINMK